MAQSHDTLMFTVGEEILDIASIYNIDLGDLALHMGWQRENIAAMKVIPGSDLLKIENYFPIENLSGYLKNFQESYNDNTNRLAKMKRKK